MSRNSSLIVVDFDWTVFDLRILTAAMESTLGTYGLSPELFKSTFEHAKDNPEGYYDRETHIAAIVREAGSHDDEELRAALMSDWQNLVLDLSASAFDAVEFAAFQSAFPDSEVVILTYGEQVFQKSKVDESGVSQLVSRVYITSEIGGKEKHLRDFLSRHEKVVSINDAFEPNNSFLRTFRSEVDSGRFLILEMQRPYQNLHKRRSAPVVDITAVPDLGEGTIGLIRDFLGKSA